MVYESQISFTLDTICPWTYLAKKRLDKALEKFRQLPQSEDFGFTVRYLPYRLYPEATEDGEDKYEWYKNKKYQGSDDRMKMHELVWAEKGAKEGIEYSWRGKVASTLQAHRLLQHFQEKKGPDVADKILMSLYDSYFTKELPPNSPDVLMAASKAGGIDESEARAFFDDPDEGMMEVKMLIREQAGDGIDSVPYVVFEGRRRDLTAVGAKEVDEYVKLMEDIARESK